MYFDVPECKRCCFCIPLRFGLVAWAYLKLASTIADLCLTNYEMFYTNVYMIILQYVWSSLDISFNIMFIVGAHLKHVKIIKVYFYYCIAALIIYVIHGVVDFILLIGVYYLDSSIIIIFIVALEIIRYALLLYITLLIKSEILKLENNLQVKFVTVTVEAASSFDANTADQDTLVPEKVKYENF